MQPDVIADTVISTTAFLAVILLISLTNRGDRNSFTKRFIPGLVVIAIMLASRVLFWISDIAIFDKINLLAAGLIPLTIILLSEGLLRRHAPKYIKIIFALFTALFIPLCFFSHELIETWRLYLLLIFQFLSFTTSAYLIASRDKSMLSAAENKLISRLALSLFLIIPCLMTEFKTLVPDFPIRLGGIAILVMCWLTITLERSYINNRDILVALFVLLLGGAVSGIVVGQIYEASIMGVVQICAVILSCMLLAVFYVDAIVFRFTNRRMSLLQYIANIDISTTDRFLEGLQNHELIEDALILKERELGDFNLDLLKNIFKRYPICKANDWNNKDNLDKDEQELLGFLFERYSATHLIIADDQPCVLLAINVPKISSSEGVETELKAVQRIAYLISKAKE